MTDRALRTLGLFSLERPSWTAEEIASALGVALSSAYRLISALVRSGLIDAVTPGRYVLGPSIIQMDRQIRLTDPLIDAAASVMSELLDLAPEGTTMLLCRGFRDRVICIYQLLRGPQGAVSYERGRPRTLFKGATSKAILAFLPPRTLKRLYSSHASEINAAHLGSSWNEFLGGLRALRKIGHVVTRGEVDRNRVGISAPILSGNRNAVASLSYVISDAKADERTINRLASLIVTASKEVERTLANPVVIESEPQADGDTALIIEATAES